MRCSQGSELQRIGAFSELPRQLLNFGRSLEGTKENNKSLHHKLSGPPLEGPILSPPLSHTVSLSIYTLDSQSLSQSLSHSLSCAVSLSLSLSLSFLCSLSLSLSLYRSVSLALSCLLYRFSLSLPLPEKLYINVFLAHVFKKVQLQNENSGVVIWVKFTILMLHKLGPANNPYLAQIIPPQNGKCCFSCLFKVLKCLFL